MFATRIDPGMLKKVKHLSVDVERPISALIEEALADLQKIYEKSHPNDRERIQMHDKKILLIDDEKSHLRMMKQFLKRFGWESVTAESALEAGLILEWNSNFAAIITDLKMPWMDGVEFCENAKLKDPEMKIYALSGNIQSYDKKLLDYAGFDGVFEKPVDFALIENILETIENESPEGPQYFEF
jgi:CheY-like chemotaxis protein